jgi:hypothetical protein
MGVTEPWTELLRDQPKRRGLLLGSVFLIAVGLIAIGISGLFAAVGDAALGHRFVADELDRSYSAARCTELREYAPHARTCLDAAAVHHASEIVDYRVAAGVLGLLVLGVWAALRRRDRGLPPPPVLVPAVGVTAFGLAAGALVVLSADSLVLDGVRGGAGAWLSGAIVAMAVASGFGHRLVALLHGA